MATVPTSRGTASRVGKQTRGGTSPVPVEPAESLNGLGHDSEMPGIQKGAKFRVRVEKGTSELGSVHGLPLKAERSRGVRHRLSRSDGRPAARTHLHRELGTSVADLCLSGHWPGTGPAVPPDVQRAPTSLADSDLRPERAGLRGYR